MNAPISPTLREIAKAIETKGLGCNCNLDKWEPERDSGHSRVCRIDKHARAVKRGDASMDQVPVRPL